MASSSPSGSNQSLHATAQTMAARSRQVASDDLAQEILDRENADTAEATARAAADMAEADARLEADTAQDFSEASGTNPYSATTPLTPRYVGDVAINLTSAEIWIGLATAEATASWKQLSTV